MSEWVLGLYPILTTKLYSRRKYIYLSHLYPIVTFYTQLEGAKGLIITGITICSATTRKVV